MNLSMKSLALFSWAGVLLTGAAHATTTTAPCGVTPLMQQFSTAANSAQALLPKLNGDVDKCFNPDNPSYIVKAHQMFAKAQTDYQSYVKQLAVIYQQILAGHTPTNYATLISNLNDALSATDDPINSNADNLAEYGFNTSDSQVSGGQYKYPQCNSRVNDNPLGSWNTFYSQEQQMESAMNGLVQASGCLGN